MKKLSKTQEEFLQSLIDYKDYWQNLSNDIVEKGCIMTDTPSPTQYRLEGFLHSILVMLDGDSSINNFKRCDIRVNGKSINKDINLHDYLFKVMTQNIDK